MQRNNDFQNSGAMFQRQKSNPKAPDMGGDFTIDGDVLQYVIECIKNNVQVKLDIAGRRRVARDGNAFLGLQIEIPWDIRKQRQGGQQPPRQHGYGQQQPRYGGVRNDQRRTNPPQRGYNEQQDQGGSPDQGGFPFDDGIPF